MRIIRLEIFCAVVSPRERVGPRDVLRGRRALPLQPQPREEVRAVERGVEQPEKLRTYGCLSGGAVVRADLIGRGRARQQADVELRSRRPRADAADQLGEGAHGAARVELHRLSLVLAPAMRSGRSAGSTAQAWAW